MQNGIGKLDWVNIKSAVVYGLVLGIVAVVVYIFKAGSVFALDWRLLVDAFVYGFLGSIVKNLLTTNSGNFLGVTKVIPSTN